MRSQLYNSSLSNSPTLYTCPTCHREFAKKEAKHWCTPETVDDILAKSSEEVVLAFDAVLVATADWTPNYVGAAKRAIVFAKDKAWMIARPARKWLDLTVYFPEPRKRSFVHKIQPHFSGKKLQHIIRLHGEDELTEPVLKFLKEAWAEGK